MPTIFIAGPASWNHIIDLDDLPEPHPQTIVASGHRHTVGGTSAGKALNLAWLGCHVTLRTLVGNDDDGHRVRAALRSAGVRVITHPGETTTERHLNLMSGGRRVSIYLDLPGDAQHSPELDQAVEEAMARADVAILDLAELARPLLPRAKALGRDVWVDLHDYNGTGTWHRDFIDAADVLFLNDDGLADASAFAHAQIDEGKRLVVQTRGAGGATAWTSEGELHVPALEVDVVDTNGAGDGFLAGFLEAELAGANLAEALGAAHEHAARVLASPGLAPE